jgi:hypothetical protein
MIRLQRQESGRYFAAFFLHIPGMRSFTDMREIVKICSRSRRFRWNRCFAIEHRSPAGSWRRDKVLVSLGCGFAEFLYFLI